MIETLQTLKQFQRNTGRVLVHDGASVLKAAAKLSPVTSPAKQPDQVDPGCPTCQARKAKALARVRKHRALKPKA